MSVFVKAEQSGRRVVYYDADGNKTVRDGGDPNWRTNNPGNLVSDTLEGKKYGIGKFKNDAVHNFAIFPDMETGEKAMKEYIKRKFGEKTIQEMMEKYAPPKHNDTEAYIKSIQKQTGLDTNRKISELSSGEFERLRNTIKKHEGGQVGKEMTSSQSPLSNLFNAATSFLNNIANKLNAFLNGINSFFQGKDDANFYTAQKGDTLAKYRLDIFSQISCIIFQILLLLFQKHSSSLLSTVLHKTPLHLLCSCSSLCFSACV
ncbi:hypothetical protein A45J_0648 [hot springs metagenome]|uniref:Uncharacterized protein n=1 Tax=hot springs metagenome TaxID=433727 RepID=A0A5J4L2D3_9ZZZZ